MIRMAPTHTHAVCAARSRIILSIHTHWRRESVAAGGGGDEAIPPAPPTGGLPPGFMPIAGVPGIFGNAGIQGGPYGVAS